MPHGVLKVPVGVNTIGGAYGNPARSSRGLQPESKHRTATSLNACAAPPSLGQPGGLQICLAMPPVCSSGLPASARSPVGTGGVVGVDVVRVVVRVVVVLRVVVVRVVVGFVGAEDVFVFGAVVPPPGNVETGFGANAERTVCGEAMATPITPSATTNTAASAMLAARNFDGAGAGH